MAEVVAGYAWQVEAYLLHLKQLSVLDYGLHFVTCSQHLVLKSTVVSLMPVVVRSSELEDQVHHNRLLLVVGLLEHI